MSELDYSLMKVLVVDDQSFIRRVIVVLLEEMGFVEIEEAEDGASGLEAYSKHKPDLIICDIEMEPIDGIVFLQTLRKANDIEKTNAAFIFLTNHVESNMVMQAKKLNVDAFIAKPPTMENLCNRIEYVLNRAE